MTPGSSPDGPGATAVLAVRALIGAFARRDVAAAIALIDPAGFELHVPTAEVARREGPYRGVDGVRRYFGDVALVWDRLEVELDDLRPLPDGEHVLAFGRVRAYGAHRVLDAPAGWLWRVRAGRVVCGRVFETRQAALAAASAAVADVQPR